MCAYVFPEIKIEDIKNPKNEKRIKNQINEIKKKINFDYLKKSSKLKSGKSKLNWGPEIKKNPE